MDYKIVSARLKDIDLLTSIKMVTMLDDEMDKKLSFDEKEKIKKNIELNINQNYKQYKMIHVGKNIAGAYVLVPYKDGMMIDEIYLFPEFRNKGIGSDIVKNLITNTRYIYVWLYSSNKDAIRFFERLGYVLDSDGRTSIYKYDYLDKKVLEYLKNLKYGYRDKFGNRFIEPNKKFKEEYYLQSPEEVLENGYGIVFDYIELERYLFNKVGIDFRTYFMIYNSTENEMSHSFLVFKSNEDYYWLECSWFKYKGVHKYDNKEELLRDVANKFVSTIKDGDIRKIRLFQYDNDKYGINYNKYIKNIMNGININLFK